MNLPAATEDDRKALDRLSTPADKLYETPVDMRGLLLLRVWDWQRRVGATDEEVQRIVDQLGLDDDAVVMSALRQESPRE